MASARLSKMLGHVRQITHHTKLLPDCPLLPWSPDLSLLLDNLVRCYLTLIQQNFVKLSPHDLNSAIKDYASNVVVCDLLLTVSIRLFLLQLL